MYQELIVIRYGEIGLKKLNRKSFINQLIRNIRTRIKDLGEFKIKHDQARIWLEVKEKSQASSLVYKQVMTRLATVFGIVSLSLVRKFASDPALVKAEVMNYLQAELDLAAKFSFKFECKRVNKNFPQGSYDLVCKLGGLVLAAFPNSRVDVKKPDYVFNLEIREMTHVYLSRSLGAKGLPLGMGGRGLLLLSGGIDSPVAGYLAASRGMLIEAVYFHTPPYTSNDSLEKVKELASLLARYAGKLLLHVVNFCDLQMAINQACPEDYLTLVVRRYMLRIASQIAKENRLQVLITGESLGQVASQTIEALVAQDGFIPEPIFRPLIALDKDFIVKKAKQISTYETSILPYEDCCTVFVPKHPVTKPKKEKLDLVYEKTGGDLLLEEYPVIIERYTITPKE